MKRKTQKKMTNERSSFWRRYFCYLLGVAKLYNVLGVFTVIIVSQFPTEVCTKLTKMSIHFYSLCTKSASNSSRVIFSFSSKSAAQESSTGRYSLMIFLAFA